DAVRGSLARADAGAHLPAAAVWRRETARSDCPGGIVRGLRSRETRRAVSGVSSKVKIWPGIDIDIPTGPKEKKTQPDDVYQAVKAAFDGGAHGVLLSRKYSEMPLANLLAAARSVRELQVA